MQLKITDIDDYHETEPKLVTPGGLFTEYLMVIYFFNT